jgi:hypothetical protein
VDEFEAALRHEKAEESLKISAMDVTGVHRDA